jgi:cellulose synthase (UDP-forming)
MSAGREAQPGGGWYFAPYERRVPAEPLPASAARDFAFQALAVLAAALGARYLAWRWQALNPDALAFSAVVAAAEVLAYAGALLFLLSLWRTEDPPRRPPPATVNDLRDPADALATDRPIRVDVLVTTFDEPVELVRLSVRDARRLAYPHPIDVRVHVLDDGRRAAMREMALAEGAAYLARDCNAGYKAGNLTNGLEHTDGDLVVICDADTRPFPDLLEETLGHFRDPRVAWVQTPQWFYDVDEGTRLPEWLAARAGAAGRAAGRAIEAVVGPVAVGADPLGCDPQAFYEIVQRCRNWCNAAFCCGAGSIHRREAVMETALRRFGAQVAAAVEPFTREVRDPALRADLAAALASQAARRIELTPYKFHVSEDIYTSLAIHADAERRWRSVYHPRVLTRMLSPQDLGAWSIQRFKYACGTLDIGWRDNPLRLPGLTPWQKLMYGATIYAYLAPLWTIPLLLAPLAFFFAGVTPVRAFDAAFFAHFLPFLVVTRLAFMVRSWRVHTWRSEQFHVAAFWLQLRAIAHVLARRQLRFEVTPKLGGSRRSIALVAPHLALLAATAVGIAWRGAQLQAGGNPVHAAAFVSNVCWSLHNALCFVPFVAAALAVRRRSGREAAP